MMNSIFPCLFCGSPPHSPNPNPSRSPGAAVSNKRAFCITASNAATGPGSGSASGTPCQRSVKLKRVNEQLTGRRVRLTDRQKSGLTARENTPPLVLTDNKELINEPATHAVPALSISGRFSEFSLWEDALWAAIEPSRLVLGYMRCIWLYLVPFLSVDMLRFGDYLLSLSRVAAELSPCIRVIYRAPSLGC